MQVQIKSKSARDKMHQMGEQSSLSSLLSQQSTATNYANPYQHPSYSDTPGTSHAYQIPQLQQCIRYNSDLVDDDHMRELQMDNETHTADNRENDNAALTPDRQCREVLAKQRAGLPILQQILQLIQQITALSQTGNQQTAELVDRLKQIQLHGCECKALMREVLAAGKSNEGTQQTDSIVLIYEIPIEMDFHPEKQQLKIKDEIQWLNQHILQLNQQNEQLTHRITQLQQQLLSREQQVVNNFYEIPVELQVQSDRQEMDSETYINIGEDEAERRANIKRSIEINRSDWSQIQTEGKLQNFSFNNCINETNQKRQQDQQEVLESHLIPEFEPKEWAYINNIYEIPIQVILNPHQHPSEIAQNAIQTSCRHKAILKFDLAVLQFNYFQNLLESRKKKKLGNNNSNKKSEQKQQQGHKDECLSMVTKQMQMLLQSEQMSETEEKEEKKKNQESEDITYKANIVTESGDIERNHQIARSDDIERQSVLFMESSHLSPNLNNKKLLAPSVISKELIYNNSQQTNKPNEQDDENNFNEYDNSHSMEPSLINGISMIRKRQEHSQTQTNSQINDYLQVYNAHQQNNPNHTQNESYESKNNHANYDCMNNCNHCGISVKNNTKVRGFNNRSLGNNRNNQNDYIAQIENVIEERYSEESKSKRTATIKNLNINVNSPDDKIDEINQNEDNDFMMMRRPRMGKQKMKKNLLNKLTKEEQRVLQLGHSLFLQKSLIMQPNQKEEGEKKKAKQRLSQHPYLNFYETSQLEQISQVKGLSKQDSQVLKDISKQEKKQPSSQQKNPHKSSFEQSSILINFTGLQPGLQSRQGLQEIGIRDSNLNYNNLGIRNLKNAKNQVYIIDGDTSSEGSRANREMKISQMKNEKNKSILPANNEESPENCSKLKEDAVDMTEFYELNERLLHTEQEKSILVQKLNESDLKNQYMRKQLFSQQEKLSGIEQHYKDKLSSLLEQLNSYDEKLQNLEKELQEKTNKIEEQAQKRDEKVKQLIKREVQITRLENQIKELTENVKLAQKNMQSVRQKNMKQNGQKQQLIEQLRNQVVSIKHEYQVENGTLKQELQQRQTKIQHYLKEIEKNQQKIEHMKTQYHEMMNNLEAACREKEEYLSQLELNLQNGGSYRHVSAWNKIEGIYESEFAKCREGYAQELETKSRQIFQLQMQITNCNKEIRKNEQALEMAELKIKEQNLRISELEEQLRQRQKVEISAEVQQQLNYLRKEVVTSAQEIEYKDKMIRKLEDNILDIEQKIEQFEEQQLEANAKLSQGRKRDDTNGYNFQLNLNDIPHRKSVRNLFPLNFHTTTSIINTTNIGQIAEMREKQQKIAQLSVTVKEYELDIDELKRIIVNYQEILSNSQKIIQDLHEKVGEYLQDAMEKQRQNEALYADIKSYEFEIGQMLRQKISIEIQNKRMKKMIAASEKRISAIGTRLIHAAKDKLKMKEQLSPTPISQNSTLKMRQLRIQ